MLLLQVVAAPDPIRLMSVAEMREEVELIRTATAALIPGPLVPKRTRDGRGKQLATEANFAGDTATWYRAICRYVAALKTPGVRVEWPEAVLDYRRSQPTRLPLSFEMRGRRAIVVGGADAGKELLEVNGRRVGDLRTQFQPLAYPDSDWLLRFDDFTPTLWGLRKEFRVRFRGEAERTVPAILKSPSIAKPAAATPAGVPIRTGEPPSALDPYLAVIDYASTSPVAARYRLRLPKSRIDLFFPGTYYGPKPKR